MKIIIAVPAYNEEACLNENILKLHIFCKKVFTDEWLICVADNNSTDQTQKIGKELADRLDNVKYLYVEKKGKGNAIRAAWQRYNGDIYCFMDADMATDLKSLPLLISGINEGNDAVIGSRYHQDSSTKRSILRKVLSYGYRIVLKFLLKTSINDAPCGFKAINNNVKNLLNKVEDNEWFFDSELIMTAEKKGYKIKEIPVTWTDVRSGNNKSKVNVFKVSFSYFFKVLKLKKKLTLE